MHNYYKTLREVSDLIDSGIIPLIGLDIKLFAMPIVEPLPKLMMMIFPFSSQKTGDAEFKNEFTGVEITQHFPVAQV